jgi:hypothetical protein
MFSRVVNACLLALLAIMLIAKFAQNVMQLAQLAQDLQSANAADAKMDSYCQAQLAILVVSMEISCLKEHV